jgi:hypothetical protein
MYIVGTKNSIDFTDKLYDCITSIKIVFLSEENINFSDQDFELESTFKNRFEKFGYIILKEDDERIVYINYDKFSAGKAAKIAYQISKSEIEFVAQSIYNTYGEAVDVEISLYMKDIKAQDLFQSDVLDFLP